MVPAGRELFLGDLDAEADAAFAMLTGGEEAMGAEAYATGSHVAFRAAPGGLPSTAGASHTGRRAPVVRS